MSQKIPCTRLSGVHHKPVSAVELGRERTVCVECGTPWPCHAAVMERCARLDLANGLPCSCGWHDKKLAQEPEQEKVSWHR